jgi:uncharacterized protein with GYD domain
MATYLTLIKFAEPSEKELKDTCKRAADFKAHAKKLGIEVKEQYCCMGAYDGFVVFDAPDDETITAAMHLLSAREDVATRTLRSVSAADGKDLVIPKVAHHSQWVELIPAWMEDAVIG